MTETLSFPPHPMPNDPLLGGIVVASVDYNVDDYEFNMVTVVLLMPEAPYYRVGIVRLYPLNKGHSVLYKWDTEPEEHYNIVPAITGDVRYEDCVESVYRGTPQDVYGFTQLGGDY